MNTQSLLLQYVKIQWQLGIYDRDAEWSLHALNKYLMELMQGGRRFWKGVRAKNIATHQTDHSLYSEKEPQEWELSIELTITSSWHHELQGRIVDLQKDTDSESHYIQLLLIFSLAPLYIHVFSPTFNYNQSVLGSAMNKKCYVTITCYNVDTTHCMHTHAHMDSHTCMQAHMHSAQTRRAWLRSQPHLESLGLWVG